MNPDLLLAYAHYLGLLMFGGGVIAQMYLLKLGPEAKVVELLPRVDLLVGIFAAWMLVTGIGRVFVVKGADYYLHNGVFHLKMTLFVIVGALSVAPTVRFLRWRKALRASGALPDAAAWAGTKRLVHVELGLLALIPLAATAMARGYGAMAAH